MLKFLSVSGFLFRLLLSNFKLVLKPAGLPDVVMAGLHKYTALPHRLHKNQFALLSGRTSVFSCSFVVEDFYNFLRLEWRKEVDSSNGKTTSLKFTRRWTRVWAIPVSPFVRSWITLDIHVSRPGKYMCLLSRGTICNPRVRNFTSTVMVDAINPSKCIRLNLLT